MPPKKKRASRRKRGKGVSDTIKKAVNTVKAVISNPGKFVKENQLISKGLKAVGNPYYTGSVAGYLGYGRGQQGAGFFGDLGGMLGRTAGEALSFGFGKKRRGRRGRGQVGGGPVLGENEKVLLV